MAQLKFGSAGVSTKEIDLSGPVTRQPVGIPAGVIGTALRGRAFVPITVGSWDDWMAKFGETDGKKFGPLAANAWLKSASALTYVRVLGVGNGKQRVTSGDLAGSVTNAGFVVGEQQPDHSADGNLADNAYANVGGPEGRLYFLGAFMSESAGAWMLNDAGLQGTGSVTPGNNTAVPLLRGILMAPSGVVLKLSSSFDGTNAAPASTLVGDPATANGSILGGLVLLDGTVAKQEFVMLLNGHKGTNSQYPNVITASLDMTSPNYFANVMNSDPLKIQQAGHLLYTHWDIYPTNATVTGSGLITVTSGAGASTAKRAGAEASVFMTTASLARNSGDSYVPNYENFEDRFEYAKSPWLISQRFGGNRTNLFRFHAMDAGSGVSNLYKISIENLSPSTDPQYKYGTFDVVIRSYTDRDMAKVALETWRGLSLDPSDDRYIAKIIGDANAYFNFDTVERSQKLVIDGNYANQSNYVRVEMSDEVDLGNSDPTALPFGFRGVYHTVTSGSMLMTDASGSQLADNSYLKRLVEPPLPMRHNITAGAGKKITVNPQLYWGAQFEHVTTLTTPNASTLRNKSMDAFVKYLPDFTTVVQPVRVGDNEGAVDTDQNGIIDADRFNRNLFALDHIRIMTGSAGYADAAKWANAQYVRDGNITANATDKTRALSTADMVQANKAYIKYTLPMQGGFDGVNIFDEYEAAINNNAVSEDMNATNRGRNEGPNVKAYIKALQIMSDTTDVDVQVLAIPGIRVPIVTNSAIDAVEEMFDAFYVMDIEQLTNLDVNITSDTQIPSVTETATQLSSRAIDTSFAGAYFPDVLVKDPTTKTNLYAAPSVLVMGALALNDKIGHPWFAPAGFARGVLDGGLEARVKLSKSDMDKLYDVNVNPIVSFPGNASSGTNPKGGVLVWGQKTLQVAASALDRVNVRRLLIDLRRQVNDVAQTIMFEPDRATTLAKFSGAVTPKLQRVQKLAGLNSFKVVIDSSTTTQADVLNNTIRGKIFVQPTKSIEYVSIDFVVSNPGATTP